MYIYIFHALKEKSKMRITFKGVSLTHVTLSGCLYTGSADIIITFLFQYFSLNSERILYIGLYGSQTQLWYRYFQKKMEHRAIYRLLLNVLFSYGSNKI